MIWLVMIWSVVPFSTAMSAGDAGDGVRGRGDAGSSSAFRLRRNGIIVGGSLLKRQGRWPG
jgi:hypothetical protein